MTKIKKAQVKDSRAISILIKKTILNLQEQDKGYSTKQIKAWIFINQTPEVKKWFKEREVFLALDHKKIIGTISLRRNSISRFFVDSKWQGKGVGIKLLNFVEERARKYGLKKVTLDAVPSALEYYKKRGYKPKEKIISRHNGVKFLETKMYKNLK
jgi:putative acetyltransferase